MSAVSADDNDQDFEINLAPIIDCFTVLITYLLVSASFISLSTLDVAVATTTEEPSEVVSAEPPPSVYVELYTTRDIKVILNGPQSVIIPIAALVPKSGKPEWDLAKLNETISNIKTRIPALGEVNIKAEPRLKYKYVVRAVEELKRVMPRVFVGE